VFNLPVFLIFFYLLVQMFAALPLPFGLPRRELFKGELVQTYDGLRGAVTAFRDGLAFIGEEAIICLPREGERVEINVPRQTNCLAWAGNKLAFARSNSSLVNLWDPESGITTILDGHDHMNDYARPHSVLCLVALGQGILLSGATDNTARVWTLEDVPRHFVCKHETRVNIAAQLHNGMFATGAWGNVVKVWSAEGNLLHDLATKKVKGTGVEGLVLGLAALGDDKLVTSCSFDTQFQIWNLVSGVLLTAIKVQDTGALATLSNGLVVLTDEVTPFRCKFTVVDSDLRVVKTFVVDERHCVLAPLGNGQLAIGGQPVYKTGRVQVWQ